MKSANMSKPHSTSGKEIGDELPPEGLHAEPLAVEADIARRIGDEIGEGAAVDRVFYAVVRQSNRKIARRMVEIVAGEHRFLAQRMEPEGSDAWYTVGAIKACAGCGERMLTLAGSWPGSDPSRVLEPMTHPTGKVAHAACGPIRDD